MRFRDLFSSRVDESKLQREGLTAKAVPQVDLAVTSRLSRAMTAGLDFADSGAVKLFEDHYQTYQRLYRRQSAVRSVVDFLAKNIAQIGLKVYRHDGDASTYLPDHPVQQLLNHPATGMPRARFFRQIVGDLAVYDRACILKVAEGDRMQLVRVPIPEVGLEDQTFISPVKFRIGNMAEPVGPESVIWLHGYSPTSNNTGVSPMETLRQILAEENAAGTDRERSWRNGNRADAYFTQALETVEVLESGSAERWEEDQHRKTSGDRGAHSSRLLPPGVAPVKMSDTAADSEYLGTRKLARDEVARAYGIPLPVLGLMDTSNWGTDQYHQMLYQDCFGPWCVWIQEEFEEQLLYADFEDADSGVFLEFNIQEKLKGSFLEQARIGQAAVGGPWMTRNEFREKYQNLPPLPGGDEIIIPTNVVLGGGPQANPADASNQFTDGLRAVQ